MSTLQLDGQQGAPAALLPTRAAHPSAEAALAETLEYLARLQERLWQSARDVAGARELERGGVRAITTNCGFLAMFQRELAAAVSVPVFTSSLMLVPLVSRMLGPDRRVGILTVYGPALGERHWRGLGWSPESI